MSEIAWGMLELIGNEKLKRVSMVTDKHTASELASYTECSSTFPKDLKNKNHSTLNFAWI